MITDLKLLAIEDWLKFSVAGPDNSVAVYYAGKECVDTLHELVLEFKDLRWFCDQINSHVVPGVTDTGDSIYKLMQELKEVRKENEGLRQILESVRETATRLTLAWSTFNLKKESKI